MDIMRNGKWKIPKNKDKFNRLFNLHDHEHAEGDILKS